MDKIKSIGFGLALGFSLGMADLALAATAPTETKLPYVEPQARHNIEGYNAGHNPVFSSGFFLDTKKVMWVKEDPTTNVVYVGSTVNGVSTYLFSITPDGTPTFLKQPVVAAPQ